MNPLDAITLLLIVVTAILGWRSGAIPQVAGLIGAIAGGAAVILLLPSLADPLSGLDPAFRPFVVLAGLVGRGGDRRVDRCQHRPGRGPPAR